MRRLATVRLFLRFQVDHQAPFDVFFSASDRFHMHLQQRARTVPNAHLWSGYYNHLWRLR